MSLPLITISRLRDFRACARLHHLKHDLLVRGLAERSAARFGTLTHHGLEAWFGAKQAAVDPRAAAIAAIHAAASEHEEVDEFELERATALMEGYDLRWQNERMDVLAVEAEFRIPLVNPDTGARSRTYDLAGKIDAIVRINGDDWIVEHKTSSGNITAGSEYWGRLRLDGQVSIYFDGARGLGFDPVGCLYDVLLRPAQRPLQATPVEARKFTKAGELYKTQRLDDESTFDFGNRIREAIAEDPNRYYQRGTVVRLEDELADARYDVWSNARQMRENELAQRYPRNPDACVRFGSTCEMFPICTGSASIDDGHLYTRIVSAHPELSGSPDAKT